MISFIYLIQLYLISLQEVFSNETFLNDSEILSNSILLGFFIECFYDLFKAYWSFVHLTQLRLYFVLHQPSFFKLQFAAIWSPFSLQFQFQFHSDFKHKFISISVTLRFTWKSYFVLDIRSVALFHLQLEICHLMFSSNCIPPSHWKHPRGHLHFTFTTQALLYWEINKALKCRWNILLSVIFYLRDSNPADVFGNFCWK